MTFPSLIERRIPLARGYAAEDKTDVSYGSGGAIGAAAARAFAGRVLDTDGRRVRWQIM